MYLSDGGHGNEFVRTGANTRGSSTFSTYTRKVKNKKLAELAYFKDPLTFFTYTVPSIF